MILFAMLTSGLLWHMRECTQITESYQVKWNSESLTAWPHHLMTPTVIIVELMNNQIDSIDPELLCELPNLSNVYLTSNKFTIFPNLTCIGNSLTLLKIDSNELTTIPGDYLDALVVLRYLYIGQNRNLLTIPNVEGPSNTLILIDATMCEGMLEFPDLSVIGKSLETFKCEYCGINVTVQPDNLANMDKLKSLLLLGIWLPTFPDLHHVSQTLETLDLEWNFITHFTSLSISDMASLQTLNLKRNNLQAVPDLSQVPPSLSDLTITIENMATVNEFQNVQTWSVMGNKQLNLYTSTGPIPNLCLPNVSFLLIHGINSLFCDDSYWWIKAMEELTGWDVFGGSSMTCAGNILSGRQLTTVTQSDLLDSATSSPATVRFFTATMEESNFYSEFPPIVERKTTFTRVECISYCLHISDCLYVNIGKVHGGANHVGTARYICDVTSMGQKNPEELLDVSRLVVTWSYYALSRN